VIQFHPSLKGSTIVLTSMIVVTRDQVTINGDVDGDGVPDITLSGSGPTAYSAFTVQASNVVIAGFNVDSFKGRGILVQAETQQSGKNIVGVVVRNNSVTRCPTGILVTNFYQSNVTISDTRIVNNTLSGNSSSGISITATSYPGTTSASAAGNNAILNTTISGNTVRNGAQIGVSVGTTNNAGSANNVISGLVVSGNTITGHTKNSSVLMGAGGPQGAQNNTLENVLISGNNIDGTPVTIEIVGAAQETNPPVPSGMSPDVRGNSVSGIRIVGNTLQHGGIQFEGGMGASPASAYPSYQNDIHEALIEGNTISGSVANGIFLVAGSSYATNNSVYGVKIINNVITGSHDHGIALTGGFDHSSNNTTRDVSVLNNTLAQNGLASSRYWLNMNANESTSASNSVSGVRVTNTIAWNNGNSDKVGGANQPDSVTSSIVNDSRYTNKNGSFYSNPQFVNLQSDYHLSRSSPAINKGTLDADLPPSDHDGWPRVVDGNSLPDLGAYEYVSQQGPLSGVSDPWTYRPGVAPGAWVSIWGANLAPSQGVWDPQPGQPLPTTLNGVRVFFNGLPAALSYVSPTLIDALVPAGMLEGGVRIAVEGSGGGFQTMTATASRVLPALYALPRPAAPSSFFVTAVDPLSGDLLNHSDVDPRARRLARPGDTIDLYAIGLGATASNFSTDQLFTGAYPLEQTSTVVLGYPSPVPLTPLFAGLVSPGLYVVRIVIPPDAGPGDVPVKLVFWDQASADSVFLAIEGK
jgi:uncharacterized protein (TIGR03437 family)